MKVTVNFGSVRVIVPCGSGDLFVRDLMNLAITRYKKATGKPQDTWVTIHNLKSSSDGGILDPDDRLHDVADDREQIIALYEEQNSPYPPHNGGDGTSASSVGTESPDIFQPLEPNHLTKEVSNYTDVEITGNGIPSGIATLQVRRGSEPALNRLSPIATNSDPAKRWSAAVIVDDMDVVGKQDGRYHSDDGSSCHERGEGSGEEKSPLSRFFRDSGRLSMLGNNPEMYRWSEAADRQLLKDVRKEPVGGSGTPPNQRRDRDNESTSSSFSDDQETVIVLKNEAGPLGIHVVPEYDSSGSDAGLVIRSIEPGGRIDRDGRFSIEDCIIEVNHKSLHHVSFQKAQEIFKEALKAPEIRLRLLKGSAKHHTKRQLVLPKKPPPPVYPKPALCKDETENGLVEGEERGIMNTKVATVTPTKKVPPVVPLRHPNTALTANTRKIGKKIHIELKKGADGLGFSITTRDNPAGGNCPIYIKNILPKGAAIEDGRLKPGDRLLEVNGIEMTGKSQTEAASMLRNTMLGGTVELVVSRQEPDTSPSPNLPRELPPEKAGDESGIFPWRHREVLTFDIPLNDTGSAGLGVSVKGKTSTSPTGPVDLGIFVKSVIHGGAASKDGRLQMNDQLVNINGISLLGMTNSQAMETLRRAMTQGEGPNASPDAITLSVARRIPSPGRNDLMFNGCLSLSHERNDSASSDSFGASVENLSSSFGKQNETEVATPENSTSEASENTVIFHPLQSSKSTLEDNINSPEGTKLEDKDLGLESQPPGRNPVIDRLTGHVQSSAVLKGHSLRNESYLRASHESWSGTQLHHALYGVAGPPSNAAILRSPTINMLANNNHMVMIEDEYTSVNTAQESLLPCSTSPTGVQSPMKKNNVQSADGLTTTGSDIRVTSAIPPSTDADSPTFCRDGFGRQSMSEKRHTQLDPRNTDTYQRNKRAREERERQRHQPDSPKLANQHQMAETKSCDGSDSSSPNADTSSKETPSQVGPSLGMRKSSSLESLQTMIQELRKEEQSDYISHPSGKVPRGRGCNESFRAAVDHSYEAPLSEAMETLEEESESGSSVGQGAPVRGPLATSSHPPSVSSEVAHDDMLHPYVKEVKIPKKKGLFKGLGSVFKFGKARKAVNEQSQKVSQEDLELEAERIRARQVAQDEQERIQEQYRKLLERQQQAAHRLGSVISGPPCSPNQGSFPPSSIPGTVHSQPQSRQERMQQLRAQYQRQHQERSGSYPQEDQEEWYEKELKDASEKPAPRRPLPPLPHQIPNYSRRVLPKRHETEIVHGRSHSFDIFKEMERPGSRVGFADPNKYSHYMNYKEIQRHLHRHQQQQHHHQTKQVPSRDPHFRLPIQPEPKLQSHQQAHRERPSSNYFEYETVQPPPSSQQASDANSNSLPRRSHPGPHQTSVSVSAAAVTGQPHPPQQKKSSGDHYAAFTNTRQFGVQSNGYGGIPHHHHHYRSLTHYSTTSATYSHVGRRKDAPGPGSKV